MINLVDIDDVRKYIADKFDIPKEQVVAEVNTEMPSQYWDQGEDCVIFRFDRYFRVPEFMNCEIQSKGEKEQ